MFSTQPALTKKEKVLQLYEYHKPTFKALKVMKPLFSPKMVFGNPPIVNIFKNELEEGKDLYTEKVSREFESEDPDRILYKWKFNPHYATDYQSKQSGTVGTMFLVPFSEFEAVTTKPTILDENEFDIPNPDLDSPLDQITLRDLAAILLQKPVSHKKWLNDLINK
jgi:hypothetical protein